MTLGDLNKKTNALIAELGENVEILVDTEAAKFNRHLVDITGIYNQSKVAKLMGEPPFVTITLDNKAKDQ